MSGVESRMPLRERLLSRFVAGGPDDCWLWTGPVTSHGYGYLGRDGRKVMAHRATFELWNGPIPGGAELDHLCKTRRCGRPDHLELVSRRENVRRSDSLSGLRSRQTHCVRGHAFDPSNTRINRNGSRSCRACHRERVALARRGLRLEPVVVFSAKPRQSKPPARRATFRERLLGRCLIDDRGCWVWTGVTENGYGRIRVNGRNVLTHRAAYEMFIGPIPEGLDLDHLCRNRSCANPFHLEPVTRGENSRRGVAGQVAAERQRAKTHCPSGHPYDEANTFIARNGWRQCRACRRERERLRKQRKRELATNHPSLAAPKPKEKRRAA
jgi:hypothetical protein